MPVDIRKAWYGAEGFLNRFAQSPVGHIRSIFQQAQWQIELPVNYGQKLYDGVSTLRSSQENHSLCVHKETQDGVMILQFNRRPTSHEVNNAMGNSIGHSEISFQPVFGPVKKELN